MRASKEQETAWLVLTLLEYVERPAQGPSAFVGLLLAVEQEHWAVNALDFLAALAASDQRQWAKLLSHFAGRYRFVTRYPRDGFRVNSLFGERIDLYERFKAASPFADAELWFQIPEEFAEVCEDGLHARGFCSKHDDFVFVVDRAQRNIREVWIRPKEGSPGADVRIGPLVTTTPGQRIHIEV